MSRPATASTPAPSARRPSPRQPPPRAPRPRRAEPPPFASADPDADAHRDDPASEDNGLDSTQLLERELGATVIEEIPHD